MAAELAGMEPAATELTADQLVAAQILAPTRPLDFFHSLIGEAVYADHALGARRLAHRRAAAILDRAGAADRVAAHLLATGPAGDPWVVERLSAAAENARSAARPRSRRAISGEPWRSLTGGRTPGATAAARVSRVVHRPAEAIAHLKEALETARDIATIAAAAGPLANAYMVSDHTDIG